MKQAEEAKAALGQTMSQMQAELVEMLDVRAWSAEYPWVTVGLAAAAGFLAASALTPARDETLKERLRDLFPEREVTIAPVTAAAPAATGTAATQQKPGFLGGLSAQLADVLKTAVVSTISSAVTAKTHQEAAQGGNGQHSGEPARDPTAPM